MRNSHEIHKFAAHKTHVLIFNFHCISRDCELKWMETGKWHLFKCFHYIFELFLVGITWTTSKWLFQMLLRSVWNKMCIFGVEMMHNVDNIQIFRNEITLTKCPHLSIMTHSVFRFIILRISIISLHTDIGKSSFSPKLSEKKKPKKNLEKWLYLLDNR